MQRILSDVRSQGDGAVRHYASALDGSELEDLEVTAAEIERSHRGLPDDLVKALELSARRIEDFHRSTLRKGWVDLDSGLGSW